MRSEQGKFLPKPQAERLGKSIGVRVKADLLPLLQELAAAENLTPTEWCRAVVEAAILEATTSKEPAKKNDKAVDSSG